MSRTMEVPDEQDEVARICALKPKVTRAEMALYGSDFAPVVRLIGQASAALSDAQEILRAYTHEADRMDATCADEDGERYRPERDLITKSHVELGPILAQVIDGYANIAMRTAKHEVDARNSAGSVGNV